jgi:hypothetical protein
MFILIDDAELHRPCGGVNVRLTQYGYRNDPYMDRETRAGHGAYHNLERGQSIALTDSVLRMLGLTRSEVQHHHRWVQLKLRGGGTLLRRIDDRCPNGHNGHRYEPRADLYMRDGLDNRLPDYADVSLVPRARAVR